MQIVQGIECTVDACNDSMLVVIDGSSVECDMIAR